MESETHKVKFNIFRKAEHILDSLSWKVTGAGDYLLVDADEQQTIVMLRGVNTVSSGDNLPHAITFSVITGSARVMFGNGLERVLDDKENSSISIEAGVTFTFECNGHVVARIQPPLDALL